VTYGRKIANVEVYVAQLENEVGPVQVANSKDSVAYLIALINKVLKVRSDEAEPEKIVEKKPEKKISKPAPAKPVAKPKSKPAKPVAKPPEKKKK
jgi:hypothetical protein